MKNKLRAFFAKFWLTKGQTVFVSGIFVLISFILLKTIGYLVATIVFMMLTSAIAGIPIFKNAIIAIRYKIVGIDALVTIAVIGAIIIGEYWEAAAVTFLFMLGDYLESRTIEKTRSSIRSLINLAPDKTRVKRDGVEIEIAPEDAAVGDHVIVKPGEKISVDGVIIEGAAYINQSAITGESIPVGKGIGQKVFSGTIIESGYLIIEAEKIGEDTTFSRILQMVEEAQDKKAKTQKFLEKSSRFYTPSIILITIIIYIIVRDIRLALTLLVISCPGALVISAPISIVAGIGNGAKNGVLFKGGDIMERLGAVRVIAFDKTGTLTEGQPKVTKIQAFGIDENELLKITAVGEAYSEHPLAKAIINKANEMNLDISQKPENTQTITGHGLTFDLNSVSYFVGNTTLMKENGIDISDTEPLFTAQQEQGQTAIWVGANGKVLGIISIADTIRKDAKTLIANLRKIGIRKSIMLTGDNAKVAKAIASETGLDEYHSQLLPQEKVEKLSALQKKYGKAAMVGDGVNDAPALATADLGIAVGGVGSDIAMETADVILMSAEIGKLSYAIRLSRATSRNIKQNIVFALAVTAALLIGVIWGKVFLSVGMLVHEASVLLVIINAARLLYYGKRVKKKKKIA